MSKLYDDVLHLLKVIASAGQGLNIHVHSDDYRELHEELGINPGQPVETPGSWLLGVQIVADDKQAPGTAVLVAKEEK